MEYIDEKDITHFTKVNTSSWDTMNENVFIRFINQKYVGKYDEKIAHKKFLDLAMCFAVQEKKDDKLVSHMLTNEELNKYGVDIDDVLVKARYNTSHERGKRILTVAEHMIRQHPSYPIIGDAKGNVAIGTQNQQMLGMIGGSDPDEENILIICNKKDTYGSAYMACPEVLDEVYDRFGGNYYLLPTSVYSVMCVKADFATHNGSKSSKETEEDLFDMVEILNDGNKDWKSILSYKIYYYYGDDCKKLFLIK